MPYNPAFNYAAMGNPFTAIGNDRSIRSVYLGAPAGSLNYLNGTYGYGQTPAQSSWWDQFAGALNNSGVNTNAAGGMGGGAAAGGTSAGGTGAGSAGGAGGSAGRGGSAINYQNTLQPGQQNLLNSGANAMQTALASGQFTPQSPQEWMSYYNQTIRPQAEAQFNQTTLPGVREAFVGPGTYWSGARANAEAEARQNFENAMLNQAGQMYNTQRGQSLAAAASLIPQLIGAETGVVYGNPNAGGTGTSGFGGLGDILNQIRNALGQGQDQDAYTSAVWNYLPSQSGPSVSGNLLDFPDITPASGQIGLRPTYTPGFSPNDPFINPADLLSYFQ